MPGAHRGPSERVGSGKCLAKCMPELPEVETIREGLRDRLVGKRLINVENLSPKQLIGDVADAVGQTVKKIERQGKVLILNLRESSLLFHLKMTGQLILVENGEPELSGGHPVPKFGSEVPNKTTRIILRFSGQETLYFNDLRKFGWLKVLSTAEVKNEPLIKSLGPEPLSAGFTKPYLAERSAKKSGPIKGFLLDQTIIAGIGNIYADEALWYARIRPDRPAGSLNEAEVGRLYTATNKAIELGIKHRGTSFDSYVTIEGERGNYLHHAKAYHQTECARCKGPIEKKKIAGRTAHFCPRCQK